MEECQMFRSKEAIQLRAIAMRFLMSCGLIDLIFRRQVMTFDDEILRTSAMSHWTCLQHEMFQMRDKHNGTLAADSRLCLNEHKLSS